MQVECISLTSFGDTIKSQIAVAQIKSVGQYAAFVLLMECVHCGHNSQVETRAGDFERQCYACGITDKNQRASITEYIGSRSVEI